jgi:hypothetical protein
MVFSKHPFRQTQNFRNVFLTYDTGSLRIKRCSSSVSTIPIGKSILFFIFKKTPTSYLSSLWSYLHVMTQWNIHDLFQRPISSIKTQL